MCYHHTVIYNCLTVSVILSQAFPHNVSLSQESITLHSYTECKPVSRHEQIVK